MMKLTGFAMTLLALLIASIGNAGADVILNFQDIPIPGGTDSAPFFTPYTSHGFTLIGINPPTGFSSGFQAHGPNSIFFAGKIGLVTFAPSTAPDNIISLTQDNGMSFTLKSIDLARNFPFDPAPTVTFTGTKVGGGTVVESFTVTTPVGVRSFQTFDFTGFTDVVFVSWGQPVLADGLHQFTDIVIGQSAAAVPEPSTITLLSIGAIGMIGYARRKRRSDLADDSLSRG
jgi:hypothetical protein